MIQVTTKASVPVIACRTGSCQGVYRRNPAQWKISWEKIYLWGIIFFVKENEK